MDDDAAKLTIEGCVDPTHPLFSQPNAEYDKRLATPEKAAQRRENVQRAQSHYREKLRGLKRRIPDAPRKLGKIDLAVVTEILESALNDVLGDETLMPSEVAKFKLLWAEKAILVHNAHRDDELMALAKELQGKVDGRLRPADTDIVVEEPRVVLRALPAQA